MGGGRREEGGRESGEGAVNVIIHIQSSFTNIHIHVHVLMRRKEESSKQAHTNNKAKQHGTPKASHFSQEK